MCVVVPSLIIEKRKTKKKKKKIIERLLRAHTQNPRGTTLVRLFLVQGLASSLFRTGKKKEIPLLKGAQRVCAFRDDERVRGRTRSGKERVHRGRRGRERGGVGRKSARASEDDYAGAGKKGKSFSSIWERFSKRL